MSYLYNIVQNKEFGSKYYSEDSFSYRYQKSKKLFWKTIYIPYGPVCSDEAGFSKFIEHIRSLKFTKIHIDLPLILNDKIKEKVVNSLKDVGFHKAEYIQDEETLIVNKNNFLLNSRNVRYVRQGNKRFDIEIKNSLSKKEIDEIYKIYELSAQRTGFKPKLKITFETVMKNGLASIAYNKDSKNIAGFLLGTFVDIEGNDSAKPYKILQLIYTGIDDSGQKVKLGYALHDILFHKCFDELFVDYIDFQGASRTKGRSYVKFKESFGGEFVSLPGSFKKINIL